MAKDKLLLFKVLSIISFLVSVSVIYLLPYPKAPSVSLPANQISDLSTFGFVEVTPEVAVANGNALVSLTGGCYRVTANTDIPQAESIANGFEHKIPVRPNMHDLMKETFDNLGIKVLMVKVVDVKDNNYIGRLIIQQGDNVLSLDSKPSDGIAIAVRTNSTIYFKESLMKERGKNIC